MKRFIAVCTLTLTLSGCAGFQEWLGDKSALQARSVASNGIVLAGDTFLLVGNQMNRLCPARQLSVEVCRGFREFSDDFKVKYPEIAQAYLDNKDVATEVASLAAFLLSQLSGFAKQVNTAQEVK